MLLLQAYLTLTCYVRIGGRVKLATFKLYLKTQDRLKLLSRLLALRFPYGFMRLRDMLYLPGPFIGIM